MSELSPYLKSVAKKIDGLIDENFNRATGELDKASAHLLNAGGKRLRPAVVMLAADAVRSGSSADIMPAALALEVTHTFTLIHDDIMDGDSLRRGVPTVHTKWDMPTGILAGDVLYARAFEFISQAKLATGQRFRATALLPGPVPTSARVQHQDMSFEHRTDVTEKEYMEMVSKKTGVLYAAAAAIGGTLAGGSEEQVKASLPVRAQHRHRVPDPGRPHRSFNAAGEERQGPGLGSPRGQTDLNYDRCPAKGRRPPEIPARTLPCRHQGRNTGTHRCGRHRCSQEEGNRLSLPTSTGCSSVLPPDKGSGQLLMDVGEFFVTRSF